MKQPELPPNIHELINEMRSGFEETIGLNMVSVALDEVVGELEVAPHLLQPYGLVHGGIYCAMIESLASIGAGVPIRVTTAHTLEETSPARIGLERLLLRRTEMVVAVSYAAGRHFAARHQIGSERVVVIHNGIAVEALARHVEQAPGREELGLPPETVGVFTAAQTAGRIVASVGLGALCERAGSRRVIQVAAAINLTAPLVGLGLLLTGAQAGAMTTMIYAWVYLAISVVRSSGMLGYYNYVLELAPAGQRPTYIGLFNTISGVLIVLPTVGGWLLQTTSYGVLFALTAGILIIAHGLSWSLPAPRRAAPPSQAEPTS